MRGCHVCKHICVFSAVACECDKTKVTCIRHFQSLCKCPKERKYLLGAHLIFSSLHFVYYPPYYCFSFSPYLYHYSHVSHFIYSSSSSSSSSSSPSSSSSSSLLNLPLRQILTSNFYCLRFMLCILITTPQPYTVYRLCIQRHTVYFIPYTVFRLCIQPCSVYRIPSKPLHYSNRTVSPYFNHYECILLCAVLCCAVLCCAVLCCAVLCVQNGRVRRI